MAELDVVRKKKSVLPWVLLGLLLLALAAFLIWNYTKDNEVETTPVVTDSTNVVDTTTTYNYADTTTRPVQ